MKKSYALKFGVSLPTDIALMLSSSSTVLDIQIYPNVFLLLYFLNLLYCLYLLNKESKAEHVSLLSICFTNLITVVLRR